MNVNGQPRIGTAGLLNVDTDGSLAANSDSLVPSQQAVKEYADAAVLNLYEFKGSQDCSANPNYPAASKGDVYLVSVAGKIGGASGTTVEAGDQYVAIADNAGGTQAGVGSSWTVIQSNLVGAYVAGGTDVAVADGGTGASTAIAARLALSAIGNLFQVSVLTGADTFTPHAETKSIRVRMVGGGGGGGGADQGAVSLNGGGGGGGAGSYVEAYDFTIDANYAYSVGAKGAGGNAGNNAGSNGADTTFGTFTAAGGVGGGSAAAATNGTAAGGDGGATPSTGSIKGSGEPGGTALWVGTNGFSGRGGSSPFGGGGKGRNTVGVGNAAGGNGGGGGGGLATNSDGSDRAGGDGSDGTIIVEEYR